MKTVYDILQSEKQIYAAFTYILQRVCQQEQNKGRSARDDTLLNGIIIFCSKIILWNGLQSCQKLIEYLCKPRVEQTKWRYAV